VLRVAQPSVEAASRLDRWARLYVDRRGQAGSYLVLGSVGFLAAVVISIVAARLLGGRVATVLLLAPIAALTFLGAVKITQLILGDERIVFYEQALLVMATSALALWAARLPVAAGLDLVVLGLGVFLAFGRVGCFMVGCCHGRPARWGVRYGHAHGEAGVPWRLVGRRVFPLQLVEAVVSFALVTVALVASVARHARPGEAVLVYLSGYGLARFVFELFRGDEARPQWLGLSQAQLTALIIAWVIVALRPHAAGVWLAALALSLATVLLVAHRRRRPHATFWLCSPWHVAELDAHLARWERSAARVPAPVSHAATTALGLRVSRRLVLPAARPAADAADAPPFWDLLFSHPARALPCAVVWRLVDDLGLLRGRTREIVVQPGVTSGLVHVLLPASEAAPGGGRA